MWPDATALRQNQGRMETADDVTRSTAESAAATTEEWSPELATLLTGAVESAREAIVGSVTRIRGAAGEPVNIVRSFYAVRTDS